MVHTLFSLVDTVDVDNISFNDMMEYFSNVSKMANAYHAKVQAADAKSKENEETERLLVEERIKLETLKKECEEQQTLIDLKRKELDELMTQHTIINERVVTNLAAVSDDIEMDVRGHVRWIPKSVLLELKKCFFTAMVCLKPDHKGRYKVTR